MNNPLDKRLLWISLLFHIVVLFCITFINRSSSIRKKFVAYGRHSRKITNAYFRRLRAPKGGYQKYFKGRVKKKVKKKKRTQVKKKAPIQAKKKIKKTVKKKKVPEKKKKKIEKKKVEKKIEKKVVEKEVVEEEMLHFNLMGETDPRVIMYQQCIQVEVDRVWQPPLGVPKGTECEVCFVIARNGSIKEFKIQKTSKVLIYDLSIVQVSKKFNFDKCLWGKSFVVTFRQ